MSRGVVLAGLAAVCLLVNAGSASAASPQRIYQDLADNGQLDHHYSQQDINRALRTPSLQRYELDRTPTGHVPTPPSGSTMPEKARSIPFSGVDLALFGGVGGPLLILGATLGRVLRVRERELQT